MPRAKKKIEEKVTKKVTPKVEEKEIVINLDTIAIPGAIIIAGLIIAGAIFFTNKGNVGGTDTNTDNNNPTQETFVEAETNIDDDAYMGDKKKAKVAIVEFSDYECPFCKRHFQETSPQLIEEYVDTGEVIIVFRDFPLGFHDPAATLEARAAECARSLSDNATYFKYHDLVFNNTPGNGAGLSNDVLIGYAGELGLSTDKFSTCLSGTDFKDEIAKDMADGSEAGVSGTPAFIIGKLGSDGLVKGKLISGAYPFETFKEIIDEYLK